MWVIVKMVENSNKVKMPVILLDGHSEVLEYETKEEAEEVKKLFQKNSDSGHEYLVKKI
jgi:hypothetical protein